MRVPLHLAFVRRLAGVSLVFAAALAFGARGPGPDLSIPLHPFGFQPLIQDFLLKGSSMLTLGFVDNRHVLVTFEARTLLKRIPNDPPTDQDRVIHAVLVELPSGHALAEADWRLHDRGQYLWNLGQGHFLLRIRDTLTTFAPLANLASGDAFQQQPFLDVADRHIGALQLTPGADVLTMETKAGAAARAVADTGPGGADLVQVNFYRIDYSGGRARPVSAGAGLTRDFGSFALTGAGYLEVLDQGHQHWAFNFDTFAGQVWELSAFDSTCRPSPIFVSDTEFIAFGCHGAASPPIVGGFNMRGEQMWQQGLYGDFVAPSLVFAPEGGRFALGRVMTTTPMADVTTLVPETVSEQSVAVYQTESGRQVLKVDCSPVEPAGQNFALSPDGLSLGVVNNGAIEIYKLPELTAQEQAKLKVVRASGPQATSLPVRFATAAVKKDGGTKPAAPAVAPVVAAAPAPAVSTAKVAAQPAAPASSAAASSASALGDQQPEHRKPPTLYTLPGDPPHGEAGGK